MIETIDTFTRANAWYLQCLCTAGWALLCILALRRRRSLTGSSRTFWMIIAIVNVLFAMEMAWPHRFEFSGYLRRLAGPEIVQNRRILQAILIVAGVLPIAAIVAHRILKAGRMTWTARLALLGIGVGFTGYLLETISLHQLDAHWSIYWSFQVLGTSLEAIGLTSARTSSTPRPVPPAASL